jgi:lactate permease
MACLIGFLRFWHPTELWTSPALRSHDDSAATMPPPRAPVPEPTREQVWWSLMPWIIVCVVLLIWGTGWFKALVNPIFTWNYAVKGLHNIVQKVPPVVAKPTQEGAVFAFTFSTATNWFGHEGSILRYVFFHSIALACLVGLLVMLQAYVFTGMIVH